MQGTTQQSNVKQEQSQGKQTLTASLIAGGPKTPKRTGKLQHQITPPEEKLKRIENEIGKRSAMQDLMYRQRQLEDAVKEARRVNIMIEEEKERMRLLKNRMVENNLSQYVTITKQELKSTVKGGKSTTAVGADGVENDSDQDSLPGLIPPIDERRKKEEKKKKTAKVVTSENMFDDNYAFYMYYLNTSGQLVTPVEQMFQDNAAKSEQIRKLQEELEKKSRVVKPKAEMAKENSAAKKTADSAAKKTTDTAAPTKIPKNTVSHRESRTRAVKQTSQPSSPTKSTNQSQPPPAKKNFLKRQSPSLPAVGVSKVSSAKQTLENKKESNENSLERSPSKGESLNLLANQQDQKQSTKKEVQDQQESPAKKFQFLKKTVKPTVETPKTRSQTRASPSRNPKIKIVQSQSQDQTVDISPAQLPDIQHEETQRFKSLDDNSPQLQLHQVEMQTKKKPLLKNTLVSNASSKLKTIQSPAGGKNMSPGKNPRYSSVDQKDKKGPQILIKKSSTIMPEEPTHHVESSPKSISNENQEDQPHQDSKEKSPLQNKIVSKKRQSNVKASIDTTSSASTLHLPPLVKTSQLISSSSYTSSSQQSLPPSKLILPRKPPKPINNNPSSSLQQMSQQKMSTDTITTLPSLSSQGLQQQMSEQLHNQSSSSVIQNNSRPSSTRSSRAGHHSISQIKEISHLGVNEERRMKEQAKRDKQMDYANKSQQLHKPKLDKHKQMEIEIRQNSVSLNQLEIQARENPVKKIQLTDLL